MTCSAYNEYNVHGLQSTNIMNIEPKKTKNKIYSIMVSVEVKIDFCRLTAILVFGQLLKLIITRKCGVQWAERIYARKRHLYSVHCTHGRDSNNLDDDVNSQIIYLFNHTVHWRMSARTGTRIRSLQSKRCYKYDKFSEWKCCLLCKAIITMCCACIHPLSLQHIIVIIARTG